jgi:hypothetical protein
MQSQRQAGLLADASDWRLLAANRPRSTSTFTMSRNLVKLRIELASSGPYLASPQIAADNRE